MAEQDWVGTTNEWRYAILPSDHFRKDSIRYLPQDGSGRYLAQEGISFVGGRLLKKNQPAGYEPDSFVIFSIRFDRDVWTKEKAKQWVREHCDQISFVRDIRTLPRPMEPIRTCNASSRDIPCYVPHSFAPGTRVFIRGSQGIASQHATVQSLVTEKGDRGYVVLLDNGKRDLVHESLVESERTDNPWDKLQDGREVYWVKERQPTNTERLQKILGYPVQWVGFLSVAERQARGLEKDGFVATIDGKEVGLGRNVEEAIKATDAAKRARDRAIFSGGVGELIQSSPERILPARETNPAFDALGYRSDADLQRDIARVARDLPSPYEPAKHASTSSFVVGAATFVYATTRDGVQEFPAHYMLVESNALEASHIPHAGQGTFSINPRYPEGVQERRYHKDLQEVAKVRNNAAQFLPALVINTNPDAVNGPPIVDSEMVVLGGNSRTMTQQLVYEEGQGALIKDFRKATCAGACYGISPVDVERMKSPILVRQINFVARANPDEARRLVRVFNEVLTQELDFASEITAIANKISRGQWKEIAQFVATYKKDDDTLNSYLLSPGSHEFTQLLWRLGVLTERNLSKFVFQNKESRNYGLFNRFGRRMVSELFLGFLLKSPELIEQMGDQALSTFETIAPYLIISACCDPAWDITDDVRVALGAMNAAVRAGDDIYRVLGQMSLFGGGGYEEAQATPRRKFLFHVVFAYRNSPAKMSAGFKRYAMRASGTSESLMALPGTVVESGAGESLQELVLAFEAMPDPQSPSGYRLPNDPILRKTNPDQAISFDLPAKKGKTAHVTGIYDTETGFFTPDLASPYQSLGGRVMETSEDADRTWRAVNLLMAAQGIAPDTDLQQARRMLDAAILSNRMTDRDFQMIRELLFGKLSIVETRPVVAIEAPKEQVSRLLEPEEALQKMAEIEEATKPKKPRAPRKKKETSVLPPVVEPPPSIPTPAPIPTTPPPEAVASMQEAMLQALAQWEKLRKAKVA